MENSNKKHVIIVVCFNDTNTTKEYLKNTCQLQNVDWIIIVDNCSTNNFFSDINNYIIENNLENKVECIKSEYNGGYSYGNNIGIKYAIKKYNPNFISISNADVILNDLALQECIKLLQTDKKAGLVAPLMVTPSNEFIKSYWNLPTFTMLLLRNFIILNRFIRKFQDRNFQCINNKIVAPCVNGSFFMARKETFIEINYLDDRVFLYSEENILGQKIKKVGLQNYVLKNVEYIHNHKGSILQNINSVSKRLDISHHSLCIYNKEYLKTNKFQNFIFNITYIIGKYTYLPFFYIRNILR